MPEQQGAVNLLQDLAVLYELSLAVGRSIDFDENCSIFLRTLMARKNYESCALYLYQEPSSANEDGAEDSSEINLCIQIPPFLGAQKQLSTAHPLCARAAKDHYFAITGSEQGVDGILPPGSGEHGPVVVFQLGDIGVLILYLPLKATAPELVELSKLSKVMDKFAISLVGCLDHQRVTLAEKRRRQVEELMLHEQKLKSLGILAGGIAHDFNNLLTAIMGNAELVVAAPEQAGECAEHIITASQSASKLCAQLLAYSGGGRVDIGVVDLNALVEEMRALIGTTISKKVEVSCELEKQVSAIAGEPSQVQQIVINLLTNASEAVGDGPGEISIRTRSESLDAEQLSQLLLGEGCSPGEYAVLEIQDSGTGIPDEIQAKIFDPFFSTKFTGRGLGLAVVIGILRSHHSAISIDSNLGVGTTFRVYMPLVGDTPDVSSAAESRRSNQLHGTVLVVDDEEYIRQVLKRQLEFLGLDLLFAENGAEAISVFKQNQEKIHAVLLDLTMPVMGGEEAFRELHRLSPETPVILMSGYSESESATHFRDLKPAGFIPKPFQVRQLDQMLRKVFFAPRRAAQ